MPESVEDCLFVYAVCWECVELPDEDFQLLLVATDSGHFLQKREREVAGFSERWRTPPPFPNFRIDGYVYFLHNFPFGRLTMALYFGSGEVARLSFFI